MSGTEIKIKEIIHKLQINEIHNFEALDELTEIYNEQLIYKKKLVDCLNWIKSDLASEENHKMDKISNPYRKEKIKFLNKLKGILDEK